eukprot:1803160-Rhodomonas_salina.1
MGFVPHATCYQAEQQGCIPLLDTDPGPHLDTRYFSRSAYPGVVLGPGAKPSPFRGASAGVSRSGSGPGANTARFAVPVPAYPGVVLALVPTLSGSAN